MNSMCRICMGQETNSSACFQPITQEIIDMVEFSTGILIHMKTGFPSHMCNKCHTDVHIAHRFKIKCVDSEKVLQRLSNTNKDDFSNEMPKKCLQRLSETNKHNGMNEMDHLNSTDKKYGAKEIDLVADNVKIEIQVDDEEFEDGDIGSEIAEETLEKAGVKVGRKRTRIKKEKMPPTRRKKLPTAPTKARGLNKFKRLFCEPCQMKFVDRKESVEHKKSMHKEEQLWICEVCGKSYAHRSSQIAHKRSHYPERYCCHHCDYDTYNKYDLIKHVKIHTGDKSYKCTQCAAAYRTSSNLRAHVRLRHEPRGSLACHVCGHTYRDRAALDRHLDAHYHVKRHACELCSARFTKRVYMKKHLLKQHGVAMPKVRPGRRRTDALVLREGGL